jgi:hypothetical protein
MRARTSPSASTSSNAWSWPATSLLEDLPAGERDTSTLFVTVSDEAHALLFRRLAKFRAEIRSIVHKDTSPATRLLHIDLFLHPLIRTETP